MPTVAVQTWDPQDPEPPSNQLSQGSNVFALTPETAASTWTVTGIDTGGQYVSGTSSMIRVWPGPVHHYVISGLPASVIAGAGFDIRLNVQDQYFNMVSTGPSWDAYSNAKGVSGVDAHFDAEVFPQPQNATMPVDYNFVQEDWGTKLFASGGVFRRSGSRWLKAKDILDGTNINSELTKNGIIYSTRPYVTVLPGDFYKVIISTDALALGTPAGDMEVPAGSPNTMLSFGHKQIYGQLADAFNNAISSGGVTLYFNVVSVTGSTGTVKDNLGNIITSAVTDAQGRVGYSSAISYFVSTKSGESARVWIATFTAPSDITGYLPESKNISGNFTTTGGDPYRVGFANFPAQIIAGQESSPMSVYRYDAFGNLTKQGAFPVYLTSNELTGRFSFRNPPGAGNEVTSVYIGQGETSADFYYYDEMSSLPAGEDGRPGQWTLTGNAGLTLAATAYLTIVPADTTKLMYDNPQRTLIANRLVDDVGVIRPFTLQPQDTYGNPTISTTNSIFVKLSTDRLSSPTNDNYGFSLSSTPFIPIGNALVEITTGTYYVNLYYRDTRASNSYSPINSKPVLHATEIPTKAWAVASQYVNVLPDAITKTSIISPAQQLTAGATSQPFLIQTQDTYSNPSSVTPVQSDPGENGVRYVLWNNSAGHEEFWSYGYNDHASTGVAKITVGTNTTYFYMVDTLMGSATVYADEDGFLPRGWAGAAEGYTVVAAPPYKLVIGSPVRRLIADTTIQYDPDFTYNSTTDTFISVQTQDFYGNVSPVSSVTIVSVKTVMPPSMPGAQISADNFNWVPGNPSDMPLNLNMAPGESTVKFYFKAKIAGLVPIAATVPGMQPATQNEIITPGKIDYFTVEHNFTEANPLSVQLPGAVSVQARDYYGNAASGDPVNGNYYTGTALFWTNGSTDTVTLNPLSYTFTQSTSTYQPIAGRFINLQARDLRQEYLRVGATDQVNPLINGWTNDQRGTWGDVVTAGVVVTPTDFAPDPDDSYKTGFLAQNPTLQQGDGCITSRPAPVAMLRLRMEIQPKVVASTASWNYITVTRYGTLRWDQIRSIDIYRDSGGDTFNGDTVLGQPWTAADTFISSASFTNGNADLDIPLSIPQTITKTPQTYFVAVRVEPTADPGSTLALGIKSNKIILAPGGVLLASNNIPCISTYSVIAVRLSDVLVDYKKTDPMSNIAAYYDPDGNGPLPSAKQTSAPQGYFGVGMMRFGLWTPELTAHLKTLKVTQLGTADDKDIISCTLYEDTNLNGTFEPATDIAVSPDVPISGGVATLPVNSLPLGVNLINQTTHYYFVVYRLANGAQVGRTIGASLSDFTFPDGQIAAAGPDAANFPGQIAVMAQMSSDTPLIAATPDTLVIDAKTSVNPGVVTQGDQNVPMIKLRLRTDTRSLIWQGLRVDRRNQYGLNVDSDVSNVKVWYDTCQARLAQNMTPLTTGLLQLTTTYGLAPSGNLFIDDEVLTYDSIVGSAVNLPDGISTFRGLYNTTPATHNMNTTVTGTGDGIFNPNTDQLISPPSPPSILFSTGVSHITITGPKGGQELLAQGVGKGKTYFVTYDIDNFATLGQTYLGLDIKTTDYFTVNTPKMVSNQSLPVFCEVVTVREYADKVTFTPSDTTLKATLSQAATNQPIISFTAHTDKSEATFKNIIVSRAGTGSDSDVTAVRIWYDGNNDGLLNLGTTQDYVIGQGSFGNAGVPGEASIDISSMSMLLAGCTVTPDIWSKITTTGRGAKHFFVTYDISSVALPEYTLGATLAATSKIQVSDPNFVDTANLPFTSTLRTLVPSSRNVTITPVALNTASLASSVGAADNQISLSSVANFPDIGALTIDSEIILYTSRDTLANTVSGLTRGAWNTVAAAHTAGSFVSRSYLQGTVNAPMLKLTAACDGFQVRWYRLKLDRIAPTGLNGVDADIHQIRVYKDNGDGILNRDDSTGLIGADQLVSSGTAVFTNGSVQINLCGDGSSYNTDTKQIESYSLITTTPTVYWVTMDIDQTATIGSSIGMGCQLFDYVQVGATQRNDGVHKVVDGPSVVYPGDPFPFRSGYAFVYGTIDNLMVNYDAPSLASIMQNAKNVAVMSFNMKTDQNTAIWTGVKLDLTGTCIDNDISIVKVWRDLNGNQVFDVADSTQDAFGNFPGLLSYGTENFANHTVNIKFKTPQVIGSTQSITYFVTMDMNSLAKVGHTVGLSIANTGYFTVDVPDKVQLLRAAPYTSPVTPISEYPDTVTFEPWPWFDPVNNKDVLAGVTTSQGNKNLTVLKFRLKTDVAEAIWDHIRISRIGMGAPGMPVNGTNSDVQYVKIYADSNFNESFDAGDTLITSGTDQFTSDAIGPTLDIPLTVPQTLRPTPQVYFVLYDISPTAYANDSVGIRVQDKSWIAVSTPNFVAQFPMTTPATRRLTRRVTLTALCLKYCRSVSTCKAPTRRRWSNCRVTRMCRSYVCV